MHKPTDPNDKLVKHFIYYYAWFWAISSVFYFFCVTFILLPEGGRDFANIILGFLLGTAVATIISFFYGSSKSSKDKTDAMLKGDDVKCI
jgi:ABC-type nitrate/sulfonate/bicarbonate transport system permease component